MKDFYTADPLPVGPAELARTYPSQGFQPTAWFSLVFGVLPHREMYQLASTKGRQELLAELARRIDLPAATLTRSEFVEEQDKPYELHHLAVLLAPHLLLTCGTHGPYGEQGVQLFFSPQAEAGPLAHIRELLRQHLSAGKVERQRIQVLRLQGSDLDFSPLTLNIPELDLSTHYNDDLLPVHEAIVKRLQKPDDKGLVILHGPPGTGKTSYIRHLCGLTDKPKLFIPPNLARRIADPEFISLLQDNTNSILLIEDAEELLTKRDSTGSNAVSNLLNLSDGLLSDGFHIQIICTFNADLARIDKALLRKGRLIASHEFGPLSVPKAQALATALGQQAPVTEPTALADLFNREDPTFLSEPKTTARIGFSRPS